jgi:beta-lactam-binding protein with PASTA domain
MTEVPGLIGLTLADARAAAEDAKLTFVDGGTVEVSLASGLVGLVAEQAPSDGESVVVGTEVTVKVGVVQTVTVPDLTGMTFAQAQTAAANVGLGVTDAGTPVETEELPLDGTVESQNPAPGQQVDEGSNILLTLYVYVPPPPDTTTTTEPEGG